MGINASLSNSEEASLPDWVVLRVCVEQQLNTYYSWESLIKDLCGVLPQYTLIGRHFMGRNAVHLLEDVATLSTLAYL